MRQFLCFLGILFSTKGKQTVEGNCYDEEYQNTNPIARINVSRVHFHKTPDELKQDVSLCCLFRLEFPFLCHPDAAFICYS